MSRAQIAKHYERILTRWPVDRLRPEVSFQNVLKKRIEGATPAQGSVPNAAEGAPAKTPASGQAPEMKQINALYSLLENRYSKEYPVSQNLLKPQSSPNHYTNLAKEIEELPDRTWWGNMVKRFKGMVRMQ
ncbi:hypothetical protein H2203_005626 [Taxawa tesnikishii (nom. ined.)]|nr:hypothetical protein H2203_005626 [Dothideales sp. JES 119]